MLGKLISIALATLKARRADLRFAAVVFAGTLALGLFIAAVLQFPDSAKWLAVGLGLLLAVVAALPKRIRRRYSRSVRYLASRRAEHASATLRTARTINSVRVIDGDTIQDRATGTRYRLAGIDAPETEDRAGCASERLHGERSKAEAIKLTFEATSIEARPTGRIDVYGRTVAYVYVDGRELGDILVERGLARPWRGGREPWCGSRGGMIKMARRNCTPWACSSCGLRYQPPKSLWHSGLRDLLPMVKQSEKSTPPSVRVEP